MTANEFADRIVKTLREAGLIVSIVNNELTEDSVVEHDMDLDIRDENAYEWNIYLTVLRMSVGH